MMEIALLHAMIKMLAPSIRLPETLPIVVLRVATASSHSAKVEMGAVQQDATKKTMRIVLRSVAMELSSRGKRVMGIVRFPVMTKIVVLLTFFPAVPPIAPQNAALQSSLNARAEMGAARQDAILPTIVIVQPPAAIKLLRRGKRATGTALPLVMIKIAALRIS